MANAKVELNTASVADIARLPGLNDRLAQRIVRFRERNGPFQEISELQRVAGLSDAPQDQLAAVASVNPAAGGPVLSFDQPSGGGDPVHVFTGTPHFLQGEIALANSGPETVQSGLIGVENTTLRDANGHPLTGISVDTNLEPGRQARSSVSIALDPRTAPGVYPAELVLQDQRRKVVFNVAEKIRTVVNPASLVLLDAPGAKVEKTVFVTNDGNVPLSGGDVGAIIIEPDNFECRIARNAVKGLKNPTWDQFVGAVSDELKSSFDEIEPLRIRAKSKPDQILPGETAAFVLEFQIPRSVKPRFSYHGSFRIFDAPVGIALVPGGPATPDVVETPPTAGAAPAAPTRTQSAATQKGTPT